MKYILALIASLFLVGPVLAESSTQITTTQSLTDAQKAELASQAAKMVADNASAPTDVRAAAHVKEWVDIGTAIGSGLASSAKELGVASNDFIKTPVGKLTATVIIWHFLGSTVVHLVAGTLWLTIVGSVWYFLYRRTAFRLVNTEYETGKGPNGTKRIIVREPIRLTEGQNGTFIVGSLIIAAIGVITIATF